MAFEKNIPEVQVKLASLLQQDFGGKLTAHAPHAWLEYGLTFGLRREDQKEIFERLSRDPKYMFQMLIDVTCVDYLDSRDVRFDLVYQLLSLSHSSRLCLKIQVGEENPEVDSVRYLWASANFLEREVWDMYGIRFAGHGDLRRILMYDEFVGHPLRKDYPLKAKQPRVPLRLPELRNTSADMEREQLVSLPVPGSRKSVENSAGKSTAKAVHGGS